MLVEQIIVLMEQAMMLMEKIIAPAAISISWMSGADDSVADQSVEKFPHLIAVHLPFGVYRGRWNRVANLRKFVRAANIVTIGVTWRKVPVRSCPL